MLPDFPKTKKELIEICALKVRLMEAQEHPILSQIRSFTQHEGKFHQFDRYDAPPKTSGPVRQTTAFEITFEELPDLYGPALDQKLRQLASHSGGNKMKLLIERVAEDTAESGNRVDAKGQPPSGSLLLDMMDKTQESFDENGRPQSSFLIHPDGAPAFQAAAQEIENDPALRARATAIDLRKRQEWLDRESRRKLVD